MNFAPSLSADYLAETGLADPKTAARVAEGILRKIGHEPDERYDGLDLHLLRGITTSTPHWGTSERDLFRRIAMY